ncbi:MAG TPA: exodeoxyribonuclease V subunit gamma, partial [Arenimonas sp.]|nr:exodeoxyribonuclease V subunit gamma [Arenimonas sp.]
MDSPATGIVVYRASRLERLLAPLLQLLDAAPPADLLAPQTVLAAHPGIKRWLSRALARERGPGGIVANLDVQLPSSWLQQLAQQRLGHAASALAPYRRESLRWRIFEQLAGIDDPTLQRYLDGEVGPRRRLQLADRLAGMFARYLVYRPDWLARWQRGQAVPGIDVAYLGPLWRQLQRDIGKPHRGELLAMLAAQLQSAPEQGSEPLHVFGISHLPPSELDVLRAVARERLVALYLPDPCVQHWSGLSNESTQLRRLLAQGVAEQSAPLDLGHPLLAAWGRLGQHFGLALNEGEQGVLSEVRDYQDYAEQPESAARLHRLQQSLRLLDPTVMRGAERLDDASLRIHACHTRLRELEVLRDALLKALADLPDLHPSEIAVMAPDIAAYAPLLPAVLGMPGDASAALPYHLADTALASRHPLFTAFWSLLQAPGSRLTAAEVHDLLAVPAIARALNLDAEGHARLGHWLRQARIAWGLDADSRARLGLPAFAEHSLAWGMDRLLAGYTLGETDDAMAEALQCWPQEGVQGVQVAALGALDHLLLEIDALCRAAATPMPLGRWLQRLHALLDALFVADPSDVDEVEALSTLHRLLFELGESAQVAACEPELDFASLRELLRESLDAVPERQPFLLGGITVCGMVPQRSIPFRMIAVLGLDDGVFPRARSDAGLDPMARLPRLGDRNVRDDDRYLFLETVMAARDRLHLSFIGEGVRDGKPRNPAAPLAELLAFLESQCDAGKFPQHDDGEPDWPWLLRHPLQPFDSRYFAADDPRWFGFESAWALPAGDVEGAGGFLTDHSDPPEAPAQPLPLPQVFGYFRDPAKAVLQQRLRLRLDGLEDARLADEEALSAKPDASEGLAQQLLEQALQRRQWALPEAPPMALRLSGQLPPGRVGLEAWSRLRAQVDPLLLVAREHPQLRDGLPPSDALAI